jgi:hypothetical protein
VREPRGEGHTLIKSLERTTLHFKMSRVAPIVLLLAGIAGELAAYVIPPPMCPQHRQFVLGACPSLLATMQANSHRLCGAIVKQMEPCSNSVSICWSHLSSSLESAVRHHSHACALSTHNPQCSNAGRSKLHFCQQRTPCLLPTLSVMNCTVF